MDEWGRPGPGTGRSGRAAIDRAVGLTLILVAGLSVIVDGVWRGRVGEGLLVAAFIVVVSAVAGTVGERAARRR